MMGFLRKLFGASTPTDFKSLMKEGAQIIDVRTAGEFVHGHINGSANIPLKELPNHLSALNKTSPVITCCASGIRSAQAKNILTANGFTRVYNGGGWKSLEGKVKSEE